MHSHFAAIPDMATPWPAVSIGSIRLWDSGVIWPLLEPGKGQWNFTTLDKWVSLAQSHNADILMTLGQSPTWASARPSEASPYSPGAAAEPANIEDWNTYVRTVATRYKGRIHYYEIWNEPNLTEFYSGTVNEMVTLAQAAYTILKQVDPTIKVVSPSATASAGLSWLDRYFAAGGGAYADVIGYHFYVTPGPPEDISPLITQVRQVMSNHGLQGKPLWNTEVGWFIRNSQDVVVGYGVFSKVLTETEAMEYVARTYLIDWVGGVDRVFWYAWDDGYMGLTDADHKTAKPPGAAFAVLYTWLNGASVASVTQDSQGTWTVLIKRGTGYTGRVLWNPAASVYFPLPRVWNGKTLKQLTGQQSSLTGVYGLNVGPMPLLVESPLLSACAARPALPSVPVFRGGSLGKAVICILPAFPH